MLIVVGSDHRGFEYKEALSSILEKHSHQAIDVGPYNNQISVDYPEYASRLAAEINYWHNKNHVAFGVLVCGSGIGVAMAANRVPGIRAATCRTITDAKMARLHNNANVVCIGADVTDLNMASVIVRAFIDSPFDGGKRHQRRVDQLDWIVYDRRRELENKDAR
jgi:ribose 5-phosphate isomerase B